MDTLVNNLARSWSSRGSTLGGAGGGGLYPQSSHLDRSNLQPEQKQLGWQSRSILLMWHRRHIIIDVVLLFILLNWLWRFHSMFERAVYATIDRQSVHPHTCRTIRFEMSSTVNNVREHFHGCGRTKRSPLRWEIPFCVEHSNRKQSIVCFE